MPDIKHNFNWRIVATPDTPNSLLKSLLQSLYSCFTCVHLVRFASGNSVNISHSCQRAQPMSRLKVHSRGNVYGNVKFQIFGSIHCFLEFKFYLLTDDISLIKICIHLFCRRDRWKYLILFYKCTIVFFFLLYLFRCIQRTLPISNYIWTFTKATDPPFYIAHTSFSYWLLN